MERSVHWSVTKGQPMKNSNRRLVLKKETIQTLTPEETENVVGGGTTTLIASYVSRFLASHASLHLSLHVYERAKSVPMARPISPHIPRR
jgi:hypothetical protein